MRRRSVLQIACALALQPSLMLSTFAASSPHTFLVAHGAWSAGWSWRKMHPLITNAGHRLITPSYTGLGERAHLANSSIDLEVHIQDLLAVIKYEQLHNIVLVAHSYGGMVATAVIDRVPELISKLIYVDAFVPKNGESLFDLVSPQTRKRMQDSAKQDQGWRVAPNPPPADTAAEDLQWIEARRGAHPIKCFEEPVRLKNGDTKIPRSYIRCTRLPPEDVFLKFAQRAKREGWGYHELDASHSPHITAPGALAALLLTIANA
jgi:pimeloyl-ACP methyl ester carboxylesterase